MFTAVPPASPVALGVLVFCFLLVLAFAFSNGFHDTANAVATVIYTHGDRPALRDAIYHVNAQLKAVSEDKAAPADAKAEARRLHDRLHGAVEYAPVWIRMLSALCLGLGTMIGYRRIVTTIGERIGKRHLSSAQGASAELVGGMLIGTAGYSGLPVSTTHIIASGVAGTMAGSGAGVQKRVVWQIVIAWVATPPATILLSGLLFWILSAG